MIITEFMENGSLDTFLKVSHDFECTVVRVNVEKHVPLEGVFKRWRLFPSTRGQFKKVIINLLQRYLIKIHSVSQNWPVQVGSVHRVDRPLRSCQ